MIFFYFDASAWVKRYYREPGSDAVQTLFGRPAPRACAILGVVEVVSTLARKLKAGEIPADRFATLRREIERDWRHFLKIELTELDSVRAIDAAARTALRGADAVHFAALELLALQLAGSEHMVTLVASDHELNGAAKGAGINVFDPETDPLP